MSLTQSRPLVEYVQILSCKTSSKTEGYSPRNGFCYKCCTSKHLSRSCKATIKCELCWNPRHTTAMDPDSDQEHNSSTATGFKVDGGENKILPILQWIVNVLNSVDILSVEGLVLKLFQLFQFLCILPERKNILSRCTLLLTSRVIEH